MRASLDTNVIIHLYKAGLQGILFSFFDEGVFIYEQIRDVELINHGKDVLAKADADIALGKIEIYTDQKLKDLAANKISPFSEACTHGKRTYKYTLQATDIYFIIKYISLDL